MARPQLKQTSNYGLFKMSATNRPTDPDRHKKLRESLVINGFLASYPLSVAPAVDGVHEIKDGQNRFALASEMGLPVWYVVEEVNYDVPFINSTPVKWSLTDYALTFARNGKSSYAAGLDFATKHHIPVGAAFALLAGTVSFKNIEPAFIDGRFKVKEQAFAEKVISILAPITKRVGKGGPRKFIVACMAVCRVAAFDPDRFRSALRRYEGSLDCVNADSCLAKLDEIYNYGRQTKSLFPLKFEAEKAMRERSICVSRKKPAAEE